MNTQSIRSIDAHAHWAPEPYMRLLAQLGRQAGTAALHPLMSDLEKRLQWMDERGVQMHVLTLSGSMPCRSFSGVHAASAAAEAATTRRECREIRGMRYACLHRADVSIPHRRDWCHFRVF